MTTKLTALALPALALLAVAVPAAAHAETASFERDGVQYVYTKTIEKDRTVLKGKADGVPFKLVVRGKQVTGWANYRSVSFAVPKNKVDVDLAVR